MHAVRAEIVIVPPLAVRNDWRPGGFTAQWYLESHLHREERGWHPHCRESLDQINGSRDTAN
jgi:hypothetical protein